MNSGGLKSLVESRRSALVCLLLAAATLVVYGRVSSFEFTNYDESKMILQNPIVVSGLTLRGLWWALTTSYYEYWHPLTWLSHMLDCQLFGLRAGWHHLVSLGLHVANTLLLFVVLRRMTGALWRSALVAALFALHPLHVESVAWIAERKDVLSGLFFMLTLWAYVRYAEQSVVSSQWSVASSQAPQTPATDDGQRTTDYGPRNTQHAILYYLLCLCFYGLGLMSKPMVMTVPFVLLLLDYWPLRRSAEWGMRSAESGKRQDELWPTGWGWLVAEKAPFFVLTVGSCAITYAWARNSGNLLVAGTEPWGLRLANVPVSYARYLGKMIWPTGLALAYPMPRHWAWWQVGGAVLVLVVITLWVVRRARSAPYLMVGWLMFLGVLVPTIRLVHSGYQSIADRYTYLPSIGLFMAVVWAAAEWGRRRLRPGLRLGLGGGVAGVGLVLCGYLTWVQAGVWRNNFTLWTHCLAVCPDNDVAHNDLGGALGQEGKLDEAIAHFQKALQINPGYGEAYYNLGGALGQKGRVAEAITCYRKALQIQPGVPETHYNLAKVLVQKGSMTEAITQYQKALQIKPDYAEAHRNLGIALFQQGRVDEATAHFRSALQLQPKDADAHYNLGIVLQQEGKPDEAVGQFQEAIRLDPAVALPYNGLGKACALQGKLDEAMAMFSKASTLDPGLEDVHYNLGSVYIRKGRLAEAIAELKIALRLKPDHIEAQKELAEVLMRTGKAAEAIPYSEAVVKAEPQDAHARFVLGSACLAAKQPEQAVASFKEALHLAPNAAECLNALAWIYATSPQADLRNGAEAVRLAERACQISKRQKTAVLDTLAAAYAEAGRFEDAVKTTEELRARAVAAHDTNTVDMARQRLELYKAGEPYRDKP